MNEEKVIIDPGLFAMAAVYKGQKNMLSVAEKATKGTRKELDVALAPFLSDLGTRDLKILSGGEPGDAYIAIHFTPKGRKTVDREKLLERGVSPEIIAYATEESSWDEMRLKLVESPEPVQFITG